MGSTSVLDAFVHDDVHDKSGNHQRQSPAVQPVVVGEPYGVADDEQYGGQHDKHDTQLFQKRIHVLSFYVFLFFFYKEKHNSLNSETFSRKSHHKNALGSVFGVGEYLSQHFLADFELLHAQSPQGFFKRFVCHVARFLFQVASDACQVNKVDAAVGLAGDTHDEIQSLHVVDEACHAGLVFERSVAQLLLRHSVFLPQVEEHGPLFRRDVHVVLPEVTVKFSVQRSRYLTVEDGENEFDVEVDLFHVANRSVTGAKILLFVENGLSLRDVFRFFTSRHFVLRAGVARLWVVFWGESRIKVVKILSCVPGKCYLCTAFCANNINLLINVL